MSEMCARKQTSFRVVYRGWTSRDLRGLSALVLFLSVICVWSMSMCGQGFLLRHPDATLVFEYAGNTRDSLRFEDRRQRHLHTIRCGAQLGAEEFALADAHGIGLLRH